MELPPPDPAFHWRREPWGHALVCRPLAALAQHVFTSRQLQLRPFSQRAAEWRAAVESVGGTPERLKRIKQVHGATVRVVRDGELPDTQTPPEADAIASNVAGNVLAVQVADCVPMLMADARSGAVAAVHAGWRGSAAGIGPAAVRTLATEFDVAPEDIIVAIGPSIGVCCYDVGPELITAFRATGASDSQLERWFMRGDNDSLRLDLWSVNRDQLINEGVPPDSIYVARLCTQTHGAVFDSFRAAGNAAGRNAAVIRCPTKDTKSTKDTKDAK